MLDRNYKKIVRGVMAGLLVIVGMILAQTYWVFADDDDVTPGAQSFSTVNSMSWNESSTPNYQPLWYGRFDMEVGSGIVIKSDTLTQYGAEVTLGLDTDWLNSFLTPGGSISSVWADEPITGTGTSGDHLTISGDKGDITVTAGTVAVDPDAVLLDEIGNPGADASINMANKTMTWNFTNPAGGWLMNLTGAASGHMIEVHQETGNPTTATHLLHLEADDKDVTPLHIAADNPDNASGADVVAFMIDSNDNDDADFVPILIQDDSAGTPDTLFKMNYLGTITTGIWGATFVADIIKDTDIDWGTGAGQVSTDDVTEGSTNKYDNYQIKLSAGDTVDYLASQIAAGTGISFSDAGGTRTIASTITDTDDQTLDEAYDQGQTIDYSLGVGIDLLAASTTSPEYYFNASLGAATIHAIYSNADFLFGGGGASVQGDASASCVTVVPTEYIGDATHAGQLWIGDGSGNYSGWYTPAMAADKNWAMPSLYGTLGGFLGDSDGNGILEFAEPPGTNPIFKTIDCPAGSDPVADAVTDTLTLTAGTGITVTGDSGADSVAIACTVTDTNTVREVYAFGNNAPLVGAGTATLIGPGSLTTYQTVLYSGTITKISWFARTWVDDTNVDIQVKYGAYGGVSTYTVNNIGAITGVDTPGSPPSVSAGDVLQVDFVNTGGNDIFAEITVIVCVTE